MNFYAYSLKKGYPGKLESLFSRDSPALTGENCALCESLDPSHGHLKKVDWWSTKFAAQMFLPGPDRNSARQWGYLAGLCHNLKRFHPQLKRKLGGVRMQIEHARAGGHSQKVV